MKTKKYEAATEQEAIMQIKDELGIDAVILSIKKIQPKGFFKFFHKSRVEVTAAYEQTPVFAPQEIKQPTPEAPAFKNNFNYMNAQEAEGYKIERFEKKLENLEDVLNKMSSKLSNVEKNSYKPTAERYNNALLNTIHDILIDNEVIEEVVSKLLDGLDEYITDTRAESTVVIELIRNRIVDMIGEVKPIVLNKKPSLVAVMGPTGVGKTTTIAKLSSHYILNEQKNVGLITSDTYRIAAIEQLKVYAEILGIDIGVVYSENDIDETLDMFQNKDIIFIDTAGRSHKNKEQFDELSMLLHRIQDCQKYLVLSVTTKYKDIVNIINTYSEISDYNIIFTKSDETLTKGVILNICYLTGKSLSYLTNGQSVPDDIELVVPDKIADELLGSIVE